MKYILGFVFSFFVVFSFGQETEYTLKVKADNAYSDDTAFNNARFVFDSKGHTTAPYSAGTQPTYYYNQVINHLNNMMQFTGDDDYIDQMFVVLEKIRSIATKNNSGNASKFNSSYRYNDNYYDWASDGVVADLWEQHGMRNIFEFFYWLKSYESDYFPKYSDQYDYYFSWYKSNLIDKWISRGYQTIFETNTWMSSHMAFITYFASKLVTGADKVTYDNIYKAYMGDGISMTSIRASSNYDENDGFGTHVTIDTDHGGYTWKGNWTNTGMAGDINHQSAEAELMYKMYLDGYYYDSTDMDKIVITIKAVLDASANAGFSDYREIPFRSDAIYRASEDNRNFGLVPGFSVFTGHDSSLHPYFERMYLGTVKAGNYLPVFYSDFMLGVARVNGTIAKPLFGSSSVVVPAEPDVKRYDKVVKLVRQLIRR